MEEKMKKLFSVTLVTCLLIGMLSFTGCKTEDEEVFDITGNWTLTMNDTSFGWTFTGTLTCVGTPTAGTVSADFTAYWSPPGNGTYTVAGNAVTITIFWPSNGNTSNLVGAYTTFTAMNGSYTEDYGSSGTWTATKTP
jgi:hypothetical protein